MSEKNIDITKIYDGIPEHPEPQASTYTPYDDDEDEEQENITEQKKVVIDMENYFEIVMMISPVSGIKLYLPIHKPSNAHVLTIQKPKTEPIHQEAES